MPLLPSAAHVVSESPIEALFRAAAADLWWPELPLAQEHPVTLEGSRYRLDFACPEFRFAIELDGHATHSSPSAIAADRTRQRVLERAGWTVCRFGGQEVKQDAARCVKEAMTALASLITEQVSNSDRTWFEEHPAALKYRRLMVPGEIPVPYTPGTKAMVSKLPYGRVRSYFNGAPLRHDWTTVPAAAEGTPELFNALQADFTSQLAEA